MGDQHTAPAEAYAPDPDRADLDSPDLMPAWVAYLLAMVILLLIEHSQTIRQRQLRRLALGSAGRPAQPKDSAQTPAASIDSQPDDVTVRMHRGTGAAPKCPELPGVLKALFDRLQQSDGGPSLWSQLEEALGIVPRRIDADTAVTPTVPVLSPHCAAKIRRTARRRAPGGAQHAVSLAPLRRIFTHASTGPPTGPPAVSGYQSCYV
jgi:hypothetical protein